MEENSKKWTSSGMVIIKGVAAEDLLSLSGAADFIRETIPPIREL